MDIYKLDTPSLIVYEDILLKNINNMQNILKDSNISLRPHTKTHKSPYIAKLQLKNGCKGITVAKLGEAEVMADKGIEDIFIAYPIYGDEKRERIIRLLKKAKIRISLDSKEVTDFLSDVAIQAREEIEILVEVNTGLDRCGLSATDKITALSEYVKNKKGLIFKGLMAYSGTVYKFKRREDQKNNAVFQYGILVKNKKALNRKGLDCDVISTGSTPSVEYEKDLGEITELRPGGYVFNDRNHIAIGHADKKSCAAMILTTVVSKPEQNRAIIDAGSKTFGADAVLGGESGFGLICDKDLVITKLNEEHGIISSDKKIKLDIGEKIRVIPNHICAAVNNFKKFYLVKEGKIIKEISISAQGKIQ